MPFAAYIIYLTKRPFRPPDILDPVRCFKGFSYNKHVDQEVSAKLLALNSQFYQTLGQEFSATRARLQPGALRVLADITQNASILDIGCGNGELAKELLRGKFSGRYVGLDSSPVMLKEASSDLILDSAGASTPELHFLLADLASPTWDQTPVFNQHALEGIHFDYTLAFAVLHHLPGVELRRRVLAKIRRMLKPNGRFVHSEWQFLNSPRLQNRLQSWEEIGLTSAQVDAGDYLLDWRRGGHGLRYVHHFTESELSEVAAETGFIIEETFLSDGERGKLGLYQVWQPV